MLMSSSSACVRQQVATFVSIHDAFMLLFHSTTVGK
jgi:hypothetical protein